MALFYFWLQCLHTHLKYSLDRIPVVCCQDPSQQQMKTLRFYYQLREGTVCLSSAMRMSKQKVFTALQLCRVFTNAFTTSHASTFNIAIISLFSRVLSFVLDGRHITDCMVFRCTAQLCFINSQRVLRNGMCAAQSYFEGQGRFICTAQYNAQSLKELLRPIKAVVPKQNITLA